MGHMLMHNPGKNCGYFHPHHSLSASVDSLKRQTDISQYLREYYKCSSKLSVGLRANSFDDEKNMSRKHLEFFKIWS